MRQQDINARPVTLSRAAVLVSSDISRKPSAPELGILCWLYRKQIWMIQCYKKITGIYCATFSYCFIFIIFLTISIVNYRLYLVLSFMFVFLFFKLNFHVLTDNNLFFRFLETVHSRLDQSFRNPKIHHLKDEELNQAKARKGSKAKKEDEDSLVFKHKFSETIVEDNLRERFQQLIPNYGTSRTQSRGLGISFHRSDLPSGLKRLRYQARERGTELAFMPRDMTRHSTNTSHFSHKHKTIR